MSTPRKSVKKAATKKTVKKTTNKMPTGNNVIVGYKAVNDDLTSIHDPSFQYEIGKEAVVTNPDPKGAVCGQGIHFSKTMDYPYDYAGFASDHRGFYEECAMLELRVAKKDILDENSQKCRASKVFVVGVVEPKFPKYDALLKRAAAVEKVLGHKSCQLPVQKLKDLFSNFTRVNKLKGFTCQFLTSAMEAKWYAEHLTFSFNEEMRSVDTPDCDDFYDLFMYTCEDVYNDSGCENLVAESAQWVFNCLASHIEHGDDNAPKAESLAKMLEAGAIPLGVSKKVVYWFVPPTTPDKWFPNV